jgi:hypothetical protein
LSVVETKGKNYCSKKPDLFWERPKLKTTPPKYSRVV